MEGGRGEGARYGGREGRGREGWREAWREGGRERGRHGGSRALCRFISLSQTFFDGHVHINSYIYKPVEMCFMH